MTPLPTDLDLMLYVDGEADAPTAQAVERALALSPEVRAKVAGLRQAGELVAEAALAGADAKAWGIADGVMAAIEREQRAARAPVRLTPVVALPRAANDNARRWVAAAFAGALAVAAGGALMLRGSLGGDPVAAPAVAALAPSAVAVAAVAAPEPLEEPSERSGVEVAAVDFGERAGSVFYVPSGPGGAGATAVVWLADEAVGEDR